MSVSREEIPATIEIATNVPVAHRGPIRQAILTFRELGDSTWIDYPRLQLWGVSVLRTPDDGDYDPVWITDGEPRHPYSRETWGEGPSEILYPIEDVLLGLAPATETSHSHWRPV